MLVAGSKVVRQIHDRQGKKEAIAFAQHIVKAAMLARPQHQENLSQDKNKGMEIGD
jgi:hypothetical protein